MNRPALPQPVGVPRAPAGRVALAAGGVGVGRGPAELAQFWCAVLGYEVTPQQEAGAVIAGSPTLLFLKIPEAVRHEGATT